MNQITVTVVSDTICPWCYVGYKELLLAMDRTRAAHPEIEFSLEYRPFMLDPKLNCKDAVCKTTHFVKKFGKQRLKFAQGMLDTRGKELGINFSWKGGKLRQTTASHRLMLYAYQKDPKLQQAFLEELFHAYFEEEKDIGHPELLGTMAEDLGIMSKIEALEFLASDQLLQEVQTSILESQRKGVTGVPFTVVNQKYAVSGAQKADVYVQLFEKLTTSSEFLS